jgi:hypothetical protein
VSSAIERLAWPLHWQKVDLGLEQRLFAEPKALDDLSGLDECFGRSGITIPVSVSRGDMELPDGGLAVAAQHLRGELQCEGSIVHERPYDQLAHGGSTNWARRMVSSAVRHNARFW